MAAQNISPRVYRRVSATLNRGEKLIAVCETKIARLESELASERDRLLALQEEKELIDGLLAPVVSEYERVHGSQPRNLQ